ncbi:MAG: 4-(cytidine 5'-diphospho)-2-C-methyl-D-erythritol kinase [Pyrinomonadaceae bacterium]
MQTAFSLPSFAKINWTLRILGKRDDGFHDLFTVFQTISLHDTIHFAESDSLELTCDDANIPTDDSNLIIKAAKALQKMSGADKGAAIHLEKRIPSPGGLGGGSSNAAVALIGLTRLWNFDVSDGDLKAVASMLGSDVPFFLRGGTAIGTGRGEIIEPLDNLDEQFILIVTPDVSVSTKEAFERINAATLTNEESNRILRVCRLEAESLDLRHSVLINDFSGTVFSEFPEIERVKQTLLGLGAINAAMSGSGASVFAIFDKIETRQAAQNALDKESTWDKFAVATISRSLYRETLFV